jgi:bifunctional DNA-binding transcriptional regulator/antitoxin component of YhaV-PrlF toxin-antitoxin module
MSYRVGPKGQIVISKELRDRLGVKPGWIALQRIVGEHVELYFLPPPHHESLKGSLAAYVKRSIISQEDWDRAREAAWAAAAHEREEQYLRERQG